MQVTKAVGLMWLLHSTVAGKRLLAIRLLTPRARKKRAMKDLTTTAHNADVSTAAEG